MRSSYDPEATREALATLADQPIDWTEKGFTGVGPDRAVAPRELVASGATLADPALSLPLLVLREHDLEHNIRTMAGYIAGLGALLAPHGKTTMSPELVARQFGAGAWAVTAADVRQAAVFVASGARRVLIANEVADPDSAHALAALLRSRDDLTVYCYVDSAAGAALLGEATTGLPEERALRVLVELGLPGRRAGARTTAEGVAVARAAAAVPGLVVAGVAGFEGVVGHATDVATLARVAAFCDGIRELGERLHEEGLLGADIDDETALVLSAGGSHYFDVVAASLSRSTVPGTAVVLRSGSYVTHDHGTYLESSPSQRVPGLAPFRPAIEVHARVLSRSQDDLVLLGAGRRDVSFDSGLPVVLRAHRDGQEVDATGATVTELNDQHAFVAVPPDSPLAVGDAVVLGISHPCTTLDKWRLAVLADDADRVVGIAHTLF